jgi:hypothetical protein
MFVEDTGSKFFPSRIRIPDLGVKKAPDPGSGSALLLSDSCELDAVLRGGIPFGHVTELVGEAGSGSCEL